jgi:hypothetical protein
MIRSHQTQSWFMRSEYRAPRRKPFTESEVNLTAGEVPLIHSTKMWIGNKKAVKKRNDFGHGAQSRS